MYAATLVRWLCTVIALMAVSTAAARSASASPSPPNVRLPVSIMFVRISSPMSAPSVPLKPVLPLGVTRTYWNPCQQKSVVRLALLLARST